jgi:hypothetical protein
MALQGEIQIVSSSPSKLNLLETQSLLKWGGMIENGYTQVPYEFVNYLYGRD